MPKPDAKKGLMIAAPQSGSGKTLVTLGLLAGFKKQGVDIAGAKAGPDYIDPAFHQFASGISSVNLDPFAMSPARLRTLFHRQNAKNILVEAMMGLFDGAADGSASPADLASELGLPVLLVIDCARQSHSAAALVKGFRDHRKDCDVAGVILNKLGSPRHEQMIRNALDEAGIAVFGALPRDEALHMPSRHLGLVQAGENSQIKEFADHASRLVDVHCDLEAIEQLFAPVDVAAETPSGVAPLGQHIAIAKDEAFSFVYPHLLADWRAAGAEISFFSPLENQGPDQNADAVFLPGGYPELYAGKLSEAKKFHQQMHFSAERGALIYGECGGYMALGDGLIDAEGARHKMLGLLGLETGFDKPRLHLGYRRLEGLGDGFFGGKQFTGHEFHYTRAIREKGAPLFAAKDALGNELGKTGLQEGKIMGSYMHLIDRIVP